MSYICTINNNKAHTMTIHDISNYKKNTLDKLLQFKMCYSGSQPNVISSLADKMDHMIFDIGSPISLPDMLKSIIKGKVKRWSLGGNNDKYPTGTQLKGDYNQIVRECGLFHYTDKGKKLADTGFMQGHFRWDFTTYMVDRDTRQYIEDFWFNTNYEPKENGSRLRDVQRVVYGKYLENTSKTSLYIETKWHRWEYTIINYRELFTTNIGNGNVSLIEREQLRSIMESEKKAGRVRILYV